MQNTIDKDTYKEQTKERLKAIMSKGIRLDYISLATDIRKSTLYTLTQNTVNKAMSIEKLQ